MVPAGDGSVQLAVVPFRIDVWEAEVGTRERGVVAGVGARHDAFHPKPAERGGDVHLECGELGEAAAADE